MLPLLILLSKVGETKSHNLNEIKKETKIELKMKRKNETKR
jgi:hypothetical protein